MVVRRGEYSLEVCIFKSKGGAGRKMGRDSKKKELLVDCTLEGGGVSSCCDVGSLGGAVGDLWGGLTRGEGDLMRCC